ncbi:glycoside hydrolase family 13 protein [Hygrophoropsis aurantiaca]|uniref:Glycoside hydrolase family 13 protein n=1 Tax=Hygrophoropsis aurantiaca TaxID=72124 RepID=A0ACB8A5X5_9AGAM|nr:glycoside hydrolase family 13 protein [Hygrophoropsis aurantiaca]
MSIMQLFTFASLLVVTFHSSECRAARAAQWRARSIYQIVTDRFAIDPSRGVITAMPSCDTPSRTYCGGSWRGIIDQLDYIKGMGFDAIWISPSFTNIEGQTAYGEAYHGYWTQDLTTVNSHFGSQADLKNLSASLHSKGMYLMMDIVVNHMVSPRPLNATALRVNNATNHKNTTDMKPFEDADNFHELCFIADYSNQTEVEQCWLGDMTLPLADLNTENPTVVGTLNSWIGDVVADYKVDGLRLSSVKYVPQTFWQAFTQEAQVFTMGEVMSDDANYTSPYTTVMDAVLDYSTWFALVSAFSSPQGNLSALVDAVSKTQKLYQSGAFMTGSFLENHDQARFVSQTADPMLKMNAMIWPMIHDGIPIVYYGQEQDYRGGSPPGNHEALWLSGYDTQHPNYKLFKSLNMARKAAMASQGSYFLTSAMKFHPQEDNSSLAISKAPMLTLLTNAGSAAGPSAKWNVSDPVFKKNQELVDVITCQPRMANEKGGIYVESNGGMPQVLMPVVALAKFPELCPGTDTNGQVRAITFSWITALASISVTVVAIFR